MTEARSWFASDGAEAGAKRHAPSALRNREPITEVLAASLPQQGLVLEIASGSGEHAVFFAGRFPELTWQPSDLDPVALASIAERVAEADLANLRAPVTIDATAEGWHLDRTAAILCINMVHISPWAATAGLFSGAAKLLPAGAPLILYGPYIRDGVETSPGNVAFDQSLRARNAEWGLRSLEEMTVLARDHGFVLSAVHEMPANNLTVVFRFS